MCLYAFLSCNISLPFLRSGLKDAILPAVGQGFIKLAVIRLIAMGEFLFKFFLKMIRQFGGTSGAGTHKG